MAFELLSDIAEIEIIARGRSVHRRAALRKQFGVGQWRKLKGVATVRLASGRVQRAEIHWYEAHGIGKKEFKIKRLIA